MKLKILTAIVFSIAVAGLARAQAPVPVELEPMHQVKFQNDFVRVFDVNVPAGSTSQPHTHMYDGIRVDISNGQISEAVMGGGNPSSKVRFGETVFTARSSPMTHTITNGGSSPIRSIFIEFLLPKKKSSGDIQLLSANHEVTFENSRVRVNKLTLTAGDSTMLHTHSVPTIAIALQDGKIEFSTLSGAAKMLEVKAGDAVWQGAGTTHIVRNAGTGAFEAIEIEIK
jgi:quercetin dioxygenase-like cupin family protein